MNDGPAHSTILFTDIEGSTRLWEREPQRMAKALAVHDELARACLAQHRGVLIKTTGDGIHAVFDEPLNGVLAMLQLQQGLADPATTEGLMLPVRSGLHHGPVGWRGGDVYGTVVNRAARIAAAAHGGQMLISGAVLRLVAPRLPDGLGLRDLGRVRLRDLTEPEHVHQLVCAGLRSEFPALRSLEAIPNNLVRQSNPFIGRQAEIDAVRRILRQRRLVTLLGPGGIGKSRLSLQVAAEVMDDYPDGVWFVELAAIGDSRLVPHAVASVLGVTEEAGRSIEDSLLAQVSDRRLLVILDNCEHLLAACAALARRLIETCAGVRILASSREPLRIAAESGYPVPALSMPGPDEAGSATDLERHDAVGLFAERVRAVQPDFRIDAGNAAVVADICRRLDGLPLAIELAAARARALSLQTISTRLGDRFRLLASGDSTVLPRQQTLRALIDWSYELLSPRERLLFCRLAVFRGGWTLEAAEDICGGDGVDRDAVMDLLIQLVEKSLVACEADSDRYRLLDTVHAYAIEKLDEAGLGDAMRAAHLRHCVRLAEAARQKLTGPQQAAWLERLDRERENLIAAYGRAGQVDDGASQGLALVFLLRPYWFKRGLMALGLGLAKEMLALPNAARRDMPRCRGLFAAGQFGFFMGHHTEARRYLVESLAIAREQGESDAAAMVLQPLGMACLGEGDSGAARIYLEEAVALAQKGTNLRELAAALNNLAQLHRSQGHFDRAAPLYTQALDLARGIGDRDYIAVLLLNLAIVAIAQGKPDLAGPLLIETFGVAIDIQTVPIQVAAVEVTACLCAVCGEETLAAGLFGAAAIQSDAIGLTRDPSDDAFVLPQIERARERLGPGGWAAAEASGRQISFDDAKSTAQQWLQERVAAT